MSNAQGAAKQTAGEGDKANSTKMLVIGCKLPNGLIMELGKVGDSNHRTVRLEGSNAARLVGGYGFTRVSEEFWTEWEKKNRHLSFVRQGLVFAHADQASAEDHAKDGAPVKTGLEPLDPFKGIPNAAKGPDGKPLVSVDTDHFVNAREAAAQVGAIRRAG